MSFTSSFLSVKKLLVSYVGIVVEIVSTDTAYASDLVETKSMSIADECSGVEITIRILTDFAEGVELPPTLELLASDLGSAVDAVLRKDMRGLEESTTAEDLPAQIGINLLDVASSQDLLPERELVLSEPASAEEARLSPVPISVSDEAEPRDVLPIARKTREDVASTEEVSVWGSVVGDSGYGYGYIESISMEVADEARGYDERVSPALLSVLDEGVPEERAFFSYWEGTVYDHATPEDLAPYRHAKHVDEGAGHDVFISIELSRLDTAEHVELIHERSAELYDYTTHGEVRLSPIPLSAEDAATYQETQFSDRDTHVREEVGTFEDAIVELHTPPIGERVDASVSSTVEASSRFSESRNLVADASRSVEMTPSGFTQLLLSEPYVFGLSMRTLLRQTGLASLSLRQHMEHTAQMVTTSSERRFVELGHDVKRDVVETTDVTSRLSETVEHGARITFTASMSATRFSSTSLANTVQRDLLHSMSETSLLTRSLVYMISRSVSKSIRYASLSKVTVYLMVIHDVYRTMSETVRLLLEIVGKIIDLYMVETSRTTYVSTSLTSEVGFALQRSVSKGASFDVVVEDEVGSGHRVDRTVTTTYATSMDNQIGFSIESSVDVTTSRSSAIVGEVVSSLEVESGKVVSAPVLVEDSLHLVREDTVAKVAKFVRALDMALHYLWRGAATREVIAPDVLAESLLYQLAYALIYSPTYRDLPILYSIVDKMVYVKEGDYVSSEHHNLFIDFCNAMLTATRNAYRLFVEKTRSRLPEVESLIELAEDTLARLSKRLVGEIVSSQDHNALITFMKTIEQILRKIQENL